MIEKEGIYLAKFFELLTKENQRKWLKNLKYAVFGLHQIAEVTDQSLDMLGAKRLLKMLMNTGNFNLWQSMIWKELEEEYNGEKGCTPSRGGPHSRGRMTRPLKNHKINWLCRSINLETEKWSEEDVQTFRYCMAHELKKGQDRHFTTTSLRRVRHCDLLSGLLGICRLPEVN